MIAPGQHYAVSNVYDKRDEATNGIMQALTVDLTGGNRVTAVYVSPASSPSAITEFLSDIIKTSSWGNWVAGDFNARESLFPSLCQRVGNSYTYKGDAVKIGSDGSADIQCQRKKCNEHPDLFISNVHGDRM